MISRRNSRQTAGSLVAVTLLVVFLLSTRWSVVQRLLAGDDAPKEPVASVSAFEDPAATEAMGVFSPQDWKMYTAMPVCVDLRKSLRRLSAARHRLLQEAAATDIESLQTAGSEYRDAIQQVQSGLEKLRARVSPDVFPGLAVELFNGPNSWSDEQFFPWETGLAIAGAE